MYNTIPSSSISEWWVWEDLEDSFPDYEHNYHRLFFWRSKFDACMGLGEVKERVPLDGWNELDIKMMK
jgi:hypothetical protein